MRFPYTLFLFFLLFLIGGGQKVTAQGSAFTNLGAAVNRGDNCFRLTSEATFLSGAIWYATPIDLNCPFDYAYSINLGRLDVNGADGIAFLLQQNGTNTVGQAGGAIGYGGIRPSLAIEVDTYDNGAPADIPCDHIALHLNGNANLVARGPVQAHSALCDIEDGQFHTFRVRWEPAIQTIFVYFDADLRLTYTFNNLIQEVFAGNPMVWWGYTASTGGAVNEQTVCPTWLQTDTLCATEKTEVLYTGPASGNAIYQWNWGDAIAEPGFGPGPHTVHWLTPGEKIVRLFVQDGNCGFLGMEKTFVVRAAPPLELNADRSFTCEQQPIEFRLRQALPPAARYEWNFGEGATPAFGNTLGPFSVTWSTNGLKTVSLKVQYQGCRLEAEDFIVTVGAPWAPEVQYQPVPTCVNGFMSITVLPSPLDSTIQSYHWDFDGGIPSIGTGTGRGPHWVRWLTPGNKSIRLTVVAAGCTSTVGEGVIEILPAPKHKIIAHTPCPSDTLFLSRTILERARPPYQYRWFTPNNEWINGQDLTFFPPLAGKFVSELIDENYCIARDTLVISLLPAPQPELASSPPCENQPLVLKASVTDTSAPPYRFLWQARGWEAEGQTVTRFPPQAGAYIVTVTDSNNCVGSATLELELFKPPTASLKATPTCANDTLRIEAIPAGGNGPYSFYWQAQGQAGREGAEILEIFPAIPGLYFVEVRDSNCASRDSIEIKLLPVPRIELLSRPPCENQPLVLQAQLQDTLAPPYRFLWQAQGWEAEGQTVSRFPAQAGTYTLTATNAYNCAVSLTQNVNVFSVPVFSLKGKAPCPEDTLSIETVLVSGTPPLSYFWQAPGGRWEEGRQSFKRFPPVSGTYKIEVRDSGCAKVDSIFMEVKKAPFISFRPQDSILCAGKNATLIIESDCDTCLVWVETLGAPATLERLGAYSVMWEPSGTFSPRATITQAGCTTVFSRPLEVRPLPRIETVTEDVECASETFLVTALQGATRAKWEYLNYSWEKNIFSDRISFKEKLEFPAAGEYTLHITAQNAWGCAATDTLVYSFEPGNRLAFSLPNVFTPNGDGVNDYFELSAQLAPCLHKIEIFDRWGALVRVLSRGATNWNLTDTSGAKLAPGVYFYLLTLEQEGRRLQRNGSFTVLY
jgi:gliding motility-associated-like protein